MHGPDAHSVEKNGIPFQISMSLSRTACAWSHRSPRSPTGTRSRERGSRIRRPRDRGDHATPGDRGDPARLRPPLRRAGAPRECASRHPRRRAAQPSQQPDPGRATEASAARALDVDVGLVTIYAVSRRQLVSSSSDTPAVLRRDGMAHRHVLAPARRFGVRGCRRSGPTRVHHVLPAAGPTRPVDPGGWAAAVLAHDRAVGRPPHSGFTGTLLGARRVSLLRCHQVRSHPGKKGSACPGENSWIRTWRGGSVAVCSCEAC